MALWGKTDAANDKPKFLSTAEKAKTFFVSAEEALLDTNKKKGITGGGWWLVNEFTDAAGTPRYKSECLVAMTVTNAVAGDAADDAVVADVEVTLTIDTQPANQTAVEGAATFGITATASSGTVTYQWQTAAANATRFTNVSGATSATLALTGLTVADNGKQYRVILTSTSGAVKKTSNAAVLTVSA